jgi:predicted transcriptional regulator
MECLWNFGPTSAERIREHLVDPPHDSSVRTLLRVLEEKGYVHHALLGKAYIYEAIVKKSSVQSQAASSLLKRLFSGSAQSLVLRLLEDEEISPEELAALAEQAKSIGVQPARKSPSRRRES